MSARAALLLLAACGHHAANGAADAATDGAPDYAVLVQSASSPPMTGTSATLAIPPTGGGNLLVVGVASAGIVERAVQSITTSTGQSLAPFVLEHADSCLRAFELWAIAGVDADVTSLDIEVAASATFTIDLVEVSGLSRFPLVGDANLESFSPPLPVMDVPIDSVPGRLLVSSLTTCGDLTGLDPASPFTAFDVVNGSAMAFLIPTAAGSYGAHWLVDAGDWAAWTVAFR